MSNHYSFKILMLKGKKSNINIFKYKNSQDIHLNNDNKYKVTLTSDVTPGFEFAKSFRER